MIRQLLKILKRNESETVRETIEDLIEENEEEDTSIQDDERQLLGNILNLRELCAEDIMIPRSSIIAANHNITPEDLIGLMVENGFSCIPIYQDNLDNIIGSVHIKDILSFTHHNKPLKLQYLIKKNIKGISPSMHALDLLLDMRHSGHRMAIVADEHGGTDGLVCFSDIMETIVGDIQDVYHVEPNLLQINKDGTIIADGTISLEELSETLAVTFEVDDAHEDIDTLGGLIVSLINRVPVRGEIIKHQITGVEFEILDADLRRVKKVSVLNAVVQSADKP